MRKAIVVIAVIAVALLSATSVYAQVSANEATIRAQLPYVRMVATIPGLTLDQYNAVVRELATAFYQAPAASAIARTRPHPPSPVGSAAIYLGTLSRDNGDKADRTSMSNPYEQPPTNRYQARPPLIVNPYAAVGSPFSLTGTTNPYLPGSPMSTSSVNPFANIPGIGSFAPAAPVTPFIPSVPLTR